MNKIHKGVLCTFKRWREDSNVVNIDGEHTKKTKKTGHKHETSVKLNRYKNEGNMTHEGKEKKKMEEEIIE